MSYGLEIRNPAGVVVFDLSTRAALFVEVFTVPAAGGNVSRTYPGIAGRTLIAGPVRTSEIYGGNQGLDMGLASCAIDYALGYPRAIATPGGSETLVYVFAQ